MSTCPAQALKSQTLDFSWAAPTERPPCSIPSSSGVPPPLPEAGMFLWQGHCCRPTGVSEAAQGGIWVGFFNNTPQLKHEDHTLNNEGKNTEQSSRRWGKSCSWLWNTTQYPHGYAQGKLTGVTFSRAPLIPNACLCNLRAALCLELFVC